MDHRSWPGHNETAATGADPAAGNGMARRTALTRVGTLAAGVGTLVNVGAVMARRGTDQLQSAFNVRDYGAAGDGAADDTGKIQAAIDSARGNGGIVFFPPGTYLTRRLTLYSHVQLYGSGSDTTVLRLWPGANSAIVESEGFSRLAGTGSAGGITMFGVRDLALDGNKAQNRRTSDGLLLFGYGYELTNVIAFNCRNDGIYSEWGSVANLPGASHQMEARLSGLRAHNNSGDGISFNGPHDSMFINCVSFHNNGSGFRLGGASDGTFMVNCHAWGAEQHVSFDLGARAINCMNCYADLDGGVGVRIIRNDCQWIGGMVVGNNHPGPDREVGVQFVAGPRTGEPAGSVVDTKILNCGTAAVDFDGDRGLSNVRVSLSQPGVKDSSGRLVAGTGLGWIGAPAPTTLVEITQGLGNNNKNLVIRPAFDLREQETPPPAEAGTVRMFARSAGGRTQLCAIFPNGSVQVIGTEH
jgi:hypothetical protein